MTSAPTNSINFNAPATPSPSPATPTSPSTTTSSINNGSIVNPLSTAGISQNQYIRHELKTPVGSIKGYISMLEEGDFGPLNLSPEQLDVISKIKNDLDQLIDIINKLLADQTSATI